MVERISERVQVFVLHSIVDVDVSSAWMVKIPSRVVLQWMCRGIVPVKALVVRVVDVQGNEHVARTPVFSAGTLGQSTNGHRDLCLALLFSLAALLGFLFLAFVRTQKVLFVDVFFASQELVVVHGVVPLFVKCHDSVHVGLIRDRRVHTVQHFHEIVSRQCAQPIHIILVKEICCLLSSLVAEIVQQERPTLVVLGRLSERSFDFAALLHCFLVSVSLRGRPRQ